MTTPRRRALEEFSAIRKRDNPADAREEAVELGERTDDPLIRALAKSEEIRRSRSLGQQQRAIVAGAELLPLLAGLEPPVGDDDRWAHGEIASGLVSALCAALDVPEVPFPAIDALIDAYEGITRGLGLRDWSARQFRARRHHVSGDPERVAALVEELLPHINYTNGVRQRLGCPGCVLSSVAWYLGPTADLALLEEMLGPVFRGQLDYPGEDPAVLRSLKTSGPRCQNALCAHMHYGRALLWRGRVAEADDQIRRVRHLDLDDCYLLPTIAFLEVAMASGDAERIRERVRLLRPRVEPHEDIQEAMLAAVRVAQALALLGEDAADQEHLWTFAEACAVRLDGRLDRPRHGVEVAAERRDGAPFLRAIAAAART